MMRILCSVKGCDDTGTSWVAGRAYQSHARCMCEHHAKASKRKRLHRVWWTSADNTTNTVIPDITFNAA